MDKIISSAEARRRFAEVSDDVRTTRQGYLVVKHGKPWVRILPANEQVDNSIDQNLDGDINELFSQYDEALRELAER